MRLVPDKPPLALSADDALDKAKSAYGDATQFQRRLLGEMPLLWMLHRHTSVDYFRVTDELVEARKQLARAQSVVDALERVVSAFESTNEWRNWKGKQ